MGQRQKRKRRKRPVGASGVNWRVGGILRLVEELPGSTLAQNLRLSKKVPFGSTGYVKAAKSR